MLVLGFAHPVGALLSSPVGPSAAADSLPLLPTPRVIAIRGKPRAFQLLDYEVSILPGVDGLHARKLATLCGYNGRSPLCERPLRALPARAPSWTDEAVSRGLESWGLNLGRGGSGLLPALARVCAARGSKLTFHTLPLPDWLRDEQYSYLARAEATGAVEIVEHKETADFNAYRSEAAGPHVVPQGGQWADAEPGIVALADAIGAWWKTRPGGGLDVPRASREASRGLDVVLPAGTGTTALFLARHAPPGVRIYAVPCNGNAQQLRSRMEYLDARSGGLQVYPRVLSPPQSHTVPLGKVSAAMLAAWRDAIYHGCLLDLVYGPVAWSALEACEWSFGDAAEPPTGASGSNRDDDDEQGTPRRRRIGRAARRAAVRQHGRA